MIERLLSPQVAVVEALGELDDPLFPEEETIIATAVDKRRREFATARACARRAFEQLGLAPVSILQGDRGEPKWPPGMTGSITHCDGYRAAVVARTRSVGALGIDAEPAYPLPPGVLDAISLSRERAEIVARARLASEVPWDRLLFCAKEAVFKSWYAHTGVALSYEHAAVAFTESETFVARVGRNVTVHGKWLVESGLALTAVQVPVQRARTATRFVIGY